MDAAVLDPPPQRTSTAPVLDVQELGVTFGTGNDAARVLRHVSFRIARGEAYGLIGESGSGKTTSAYAVMRYLGGGHATGRILLAGRDVLALPPRELAAIRGRGAAMIYQDPMSALNPAISVGEQVAEAIRLHHGATRPQAAQRTVALLRQVRLPHPETIVARYPHQLSGGQQQRVVIAMALACAPELLILDEPTTGLDVTTEAVILDLLAELRRTTGIAMLFISHNIGVIARICDRVGVLYAGQLIEEGATSDILHAPRHPYTIGLMRALPRSDGPPTRLVAIPGRLPDLRTPPPACIFEARCPLATTECRTVMPALEPGHAPPGHRSRCHFRDEVATLLPPPPIERLHRPADPGSRPLLEVVGLEKRFGARPFLPFLRRPSVPAVDDVTITVPPGRTLAVVGESGSGKSTLARCVAGLILPDAGDIRFGGAVLPPLVRRRTKAEQRDIQFVFQNPDAALNPHWTVGQVIARAVERFADLPAGGVRARVAELLEIVNLGPRYLDRYPRQLSGGEKQRVGIARAFAGDPRLVICDEPTSALDISVQAAIINQLIALQRLKGTAYLFITHDLGVVRQVADHVAVMQHGRIVESGDADAIFANPQADYTRELLAPGRTP